MTCDLLSPNPARLLAEQALLAEQVAGSFFQRLRSNAAALARAHALLTPLCGDPTEAGAALHPTLFDLYYEARDVALDAESLGARCKATAQAVSASRERAAVASAELGLAWDVGAASVTARVRARLNAASNGASGRVAPVDVIEHLNAEQWSVLRRALGLVRTVWPEMHQELGATVQCMVPIAGEAAIGAADLCSHGAVYMNLTRFVEPVRLAEELIHEASHVRLNTLMAVEDVVLNSPSEVFWSPLRRDSRPMIGLVHQTFVLSRLSMFYERVSARDASERHHVTKIQQLLAGGLAIVREHGKLSEVGRELLSQMEACSHLGVAA